MKKISKKMKPFLTFMLAVSMIVTAVPQTGMQVLAAGTEVPEAEETSITQETSEEDIVTEPSDGTEEESDSDDESSDEEIEDEETENEETDDEPNPEDEEIPDDDADDSVTDETEEDETDSVEEADEVTTDGEISLFSSEAGFTISTAGIITKYNGTDKDVVIPDAINGTTVNGIGYQAFWNKTTIQSVVFSNNITSIDTSAFAGCTALKTVVFNDGLTTIGNQAFQKCSSLKDITLPEGLETIGTEAFYQAALGERLDTGAIQTGTLEIPGSVKSIGSGAFKSCTYLGEVIFKNGTNEELALNCNTNGVFGDCLNLKRVELPDRLEKTGDDTFRGCSSLEEVVFGSGLTNIEKRVFFGCGSLKSVKFPDTLEEIGDEAFSKCASLNCMELPEGLKILGYNAFYQAAMGEKKSTGEVIYGSLTFPSTIQSIGGGAFYESAYLREVIFKENSDVNAVLEINAGTYGAFQSCSNLKTVILPDRLKKIQRSTFNNCAALEEVTLGKNLLEIEYSAFYGCSSLKCVELPEGLMTIGYNAFYKTAMGEKKSTGEIVTGSLKIPSTVQTIGTSAFAHCEYLGEVIFENGDTVVLSLGNPSGDAFKYCPNLKTVILPDRLEDTGAYTFMDCTSLEKVVCGEKLKTIGNSAFYGCTALKDVTLNQRLETIQSNAFYQCSSLKDIELPEGLVTIGASAFYKAGFGEKKSTGEIVTGSLTIPSTVQSIGSSAFAFSEYLGEVIFENGETVVLTIGNSAFAHCTNLEKVLLPNRLHTLDFGIFSYSMKLNTLYIPATVTTISGSYSKYTYSSELVIYGEQGSKAEEFAKKNNIPFKDKSGLGLYVTGISLSPTKIMRAFALTDEELSKGEVTIQLNVDVKPSTAQNKAVTYRVTGQPEGVQVATVSDTGVISLTGYGEATITATAVDTENGIKTAECKVIVLHQWTEEEKAAAREKLYELNQVGKSDQETPSQFTLVTNVNTNLQKDFPLNTGSENFTAEWRLPYAVQPGTYSVYDVILKKDGYEDTTLKGMTIEGIQVQGITIDGDSSISIQKNKSKRLTSQISVKGYQNDEILQSLVESSVLDYEIHWKSAKSANVTVKVAEETQGKEANLTGVTQSKGTAITAELVLTNKVSKTSATLTAQIKVDVLDADVVDAIVISVTDNSENDPELNAELTQEISDTGIITRENIPKETTYSLKAEVFADGKTIDCPLTWSSSDTKVVQVKGQPGGSAVLTVKAATGSATVFVTAAKNGGRSASFKMTLRDSTPRLETGNVTLNLNLEKPESIVTIRPSDGHLIQEDATLKIIDASTKADTIFTIGRKVSSAEESIEYCIGVQKDAAASLTTGKHKVLLHVETKAAGETEAHPHDLLLTIQVNKLVPKVTITQTAINLYEKEGTGTLQVTSNVPISSIVYTPNATSGVRLVKKGEADINDDGLNGSLNYTLEGGKSDNYKTAGAKGKLTVTFEGYKAGTEYEYSKAITLKTNKTLPQFTAPGMTLYTDSTEANSAPVTITNKAAGNTLTAGDGYTVKLSGNAPENYTIKDQTAEQLPIVQASNGAKGKTLKFEITNQDWIEGINAMVSCKVKIGKTPALSFSNAKVTLNTKYTLDECDPVEVKPYIAGFEDDITITEIKDKDISGKDTKSRDVLNNGALQLKFEDGVIKAGITNAGAFSGTKKYTYQVTARTSKGLSVTGTLTVTVTKSAPSVTLKASGSIDLADRQGSKSAVVYKIGTKNFTDDIQSVELSGPYASCFKLTYENGAATVRAEENRELKIKTKYPLTVKVKYASGAVLSKEVTITPKQSSPKFTTDIKKATLFESAPGETYGQKIFFSGKTETPIEKIELVSGQNAFAYAYGEDGSGTLYVTKDAYAKTNKTYKLKFAITLKDAAVNAPPIYVTVQVKYNK